MLVVDFNEFTNLLFFHFIGYTIEAPGYFTKKAMADTVTNGRNGLGSIYVWAAGNGLSGIVFLSLSLSLRSFLTFYFQKMITATMMDTQPVDIP